MQSAPALPPHTADEDGIALVLSLPGGRLRASRDHPRAREVRRAHDDWFRSLLASIQLPGAERLFHECEGAGLMCRVLPDADAERLVGISVAASALLLLDDVADDDAGERARAEDYAAVVRGSAPSEGSAPLRLLGRTLERSRRGVPERLWTRFVTGFCEVIAAGAAKDPEPVGDYDRYLSVRRADSAFDLVGVAIEHGLGLDLTAAQAVCGERLAELHAACFEHTILVNDLLSFRKEYYRGEPMNALAVLCRGERMQLQAAVDAVCDRITRAEERFLSLSGELAGRHAGRHPELVPYLSGWEQMLGGNLHWSLACPRYHGPGHTWTGGGLPRRMVLHPDRTVFG